MVKSLALNASEPSRYFGINSKHRAPKKVAVAKKPAIAKPEGVKKPAGAVKPSAPKGKK